jgi:hypothetical protein
MDLIDWVVFVVLAISPNPTVRQYHTLTIHDPHGVAHHN